MTRSTLMKIGVATAALAAAKVAYSAWQGRRAPSQVGYVSDSAGNDRDAAGKPADAFSAHAVQHDLSVGEGA